MFSPKSSLISYLVVQWWSRGTLGFWFLQDPQVRLLIFPCSPQVQVGFLQTPSLQLLSPFQNPTTPGLWNFKQIPKSLPVMTSFKPETSPSTVKNHTICALFHFNTQNLKPWNPPVSRQLLVKVLPKPSRFHYRS